MEPSTCMGGAHAAADGPQLERTLAVLEHLPLTCYPSPRSPASLLQPTLAQSSHVFLVFWRSSASSLQRQVLLPCCCCCCCRFVQSWILKIHPDPSRSIMDGSISLRPFHQDPSFRSAGTFSHLICAQRVMQPLVKPTWHSIAKPWPPPSSTCRRSNR